MKDTFTTTFLPLNQVNLNGRIYQDNENLRQCIKEFNEKQQQLHVAYGELGYPDTFDTTLRRVSHTIENVRIEVDKVVGEIKVLNTQCGKELKGLLANGARMSFRPRSAGVTNHDGTVTLKKIFSFDAIDGTFDAFNPDNAEIFNKLRVEPIVEGLRVYSELDPYGEEDWSDSD
jgi:hypothetical protein